MDIAPQARPVHLPNYHEISNDVHDASKETIKSRITHININRKSHQMVEDRRESFSREE